MGPVMAMAVRTGGTGDRSSTQPSKQRGAQEGDAESQGAERT